MIYIYKYSSIGDYSMPSPLTNMPDILGKDIYFSETESQAVRELYHRVASHPSNMTSHNVRKEALIEKIKSLYIEVFPEAFI